MAKSLKDQNRWPLLLAILVNVAVFYVVVKTGTVSRESLDQLLQDWKTLVPTGAAFVFTSVLNALLSTNNKARLIFWRQYSLRFVMGRR